jgi:hypothetical protein
MCGPDVVGALVELPALGVRAVGVEGLLDLETAPLATNECLAEHTIAYLAQQASNDNPLDPAGAIGISANWTLDRPRHPTPDEAVTALRSYRAKLARGDYYPPRSYEGVESLLTRFGRDAKLLDELEAWRLDEELPWDVRTRAAWLKCCHR